MKVGDKIVGVNDMPINFHDEFFNEVPKHKGELLTISVLRGKDTVAIKAMVNKQGKLGVWPSIDINKLFVTKKTEYTLLAAIPAGYHKAGDTFTNYIKQLKLLFSPKVEGYKHLGGFITLGSAFDPQWDWHQFWSFTAFLSIVLAIMNLLPIPALDGGHVLFTLYEMITRRKPNEKFLEYAQMAGMILLLGLMYLANGNDIIKLFTK